MSDLFMNMQRRQRWQQESPQRQQQQQQQQQANTNGLTKRSSRAATPGPTIISRSQTQSPIKNYEVPQRHEIPTGDENQKEYNAIDEDPLANILSLKLRKPKHWKWELSTSKSCTNIAMPRILLYDHKGNLLVDAPPGENSSGEQIFKQEDYEGIKTPEMSKKRPYSHKRSVTTNLTHSVRKALEKEFDGLEIQEVNTDHDSRNTPSASSTATGTTTATTTLRSRRSRKPIDFNTKDLSDISRRSSSARGVRFHVDTEFEEKIPDFLPTPPSTTTPTTSSSSGPREKRKFRRSHSSGRSSSSRSLSILERFSSQRGRYSSPETEDDCQPQDRPQSLRYFLRTDEAGTLLVHQNSSSSSQNPRRKRKTHKQQTSSESIHNNPESLMPIGQDSLNSPKTPSDASTTPSSRERRRKVIPIRRHRTENDILAGKNLSTSEENEEETEVEHKPRVISHCPTLGVGCPCQRLRKYTRNETRDLNSSISPLGLQRNGKVR